MCRIPPTRRCDVRDHDSKAAFNFLMLLFSLTETGTTHTAPIVTVPAR